MTFRRKLLVVFALTVFLSVAAVALLVALDAAEPTVCIRLS